MPTCTSVSPGESPAVHGVHLSPSSLIPCFTPFLSSLPPLPCLCKCSSQNQLSKPLLFTVLSCDFGFFLCFRIVLSQECIAYVFSSSIWSSLRAGHPDGSAGLPHFALNSMLPIGFFRYVGSAGGYQCPCLLGCEQSTWL